MMFRNRNHWAAKEAHDSRVEPDSSSRRIILLRRHVCRRSKRKQPWRGKQRLARLPSALCFLSLHSLFFCIHSSASTDSSRTAFSSLLSWPLFLSLSASYCRTLQRRGRQNEFVFVVALVFVETFAELEFVSLWSPIARDTRLILRPTEFLGPFSSGVEIRFRSRAPGSFARELLLGFDSPPRRECLTSFRQLSPEKVLDFICLIRCKRSLSIL